MKRKNKQAAKAQKRIKKALAYARQGMPHGCPVQFSRAQKSLYA